VINTALVGSVEHDECADPHSPGAGWPKESQLVMIRLRPVFALDSGVQGSDDATRRTDALL